MSDVLVVPELTGIGSEVPKTQSLDDSLGTLQKVDTPYGDINCFVQGNPNNKHNLLMITYHAAGLNHRSCFGNFFGASSCAGILESIQVVHIDAPGQGENAPGYTSENGYPTLEQLVEQVDSVADHFKAKRLILVGAGSGGYILTKYALEHQGRVGALCVIGSSLHSGGWLEWAYNGVSNLQIDIGGTMTNFAANNILSGLFSPRTLSDNLDLVTTYKDYLVNRMNPGNLSMHIKSVSRRNDLTPKFDKTVKVPILFVYGSEAPEFREMEESIYTLDQTRTSFVEIRGCGILSHEEHPARVGQSLILFLQGQGFLLHLITTPE
eukprot:m.338188 g.338188  ORF g.338188 m.338188 type:complete len:323 (+) comp18334_c0_seq1:48-1016(+)